MPWPTYYFLLPKKGESRRRRGKKEKECFEQLSDFFLHSIRGYASKYGGEKKEKERKSLSKRRRKRKKTQGLSPLDSALF